MNWWHRLLRKKQMEEQFEKELRFHLERAGRPDSPWAVRSR
jgi:hypothetical protein